jgi:purine-cytosine permease-like protein
MNSIRAFAERNIITAFMIDHRIKDSAVDSAYDVSVPTLPSVLTCYLTYCLLQVLVQIQGAAFATALGSNAAWSRAYTEGGLAGLLHVVLLPAGQGFSRFLLVVLAFSVTANIAPTLYSFSLSAQTTLPFNFIVRVPRFVFSTLATAALVPIAIVGATRFYDALTNFLGLISYVRLPYL